MTAVDRQEVWKRAAGACEYCQLPQSLTILPHAVDHIRALSHRGADRVENLALSCFYCNSFKGPNVAGFDPLTETLQPLLNPRTQNWHRHFHWDGAVLVGKSAIGRTTIAVLQINQHSRFEHRARLMAAQCFPPADSE